MAVKFHKKVKIRIMLALMLTVLVSLGIWQLKRLAWKEALLARIEAQMQAAPVPLPDAAEGPAAWEYRQVELAGVYDAGRIFWLQPRTENGKAGAHMLLWLQRAGGAAPVLVNRGFVPQEKKGDMDVPAGVQTLRGIVQIPHKNAFTPENDPARGDWYWADIPAMAAAAGYGDVWPAVVTLPPSGADYPSGFAVAAQIRNDHLQYALFWFGMAAILLVVFVLSQRGNPATPAKRE